MANQPARTTSAGTRDVAGESAPLTQGEQDEIRESDTADNAIKGAGPDLSGRRLRAIPAVITKSGDKGTTVEVRDIDFAQKGIEHPTVSFDARNNNYTLAVGDGDGAEISTKAADFLAKSYPTSFEYLDNGE